jgi:hypothetical protein
MLTLAQPGKREAQDHAAVPLPRRARVRPKPRLYSEFLKSGAEGRNLEIFPGRGPHEVAAERYLSQLCRNKPVASVPLNRDRRDVLRLWRTSDLWVPEAPLNSG